MTPEQFAKAKQQFLEWLELPPDARGLALSTLDDEDPVVAGEVRSLVNNHVSRTILQSQEPTGGGKQDFTSPSTFPTSFCRLKFGILGGWFPLISSIGAAIFLAALGASVKFAIHHQIEQAKIAHLRSVIDLEQEVLRQWADAVVLRVESWARSPAIRDAVAELAAIGRSTLGEEADLRKALLTSKAHEKLESELNALAGIVWSSDEPPETCQKFAVWNREGVALTDWNRRQYPETVGRGCTADGAAKISRVFTRSSEDEGRTFVYLPRAVRDERMTADDPSGSVTPQIQVMTAIHDDAGHPIAALMIRDQSFADDLQRAMLSGSFEETGESYLIDSDAWMIHESVHSDELESQEVYRELANRKVVRVADPGGDLLRGYHPTEPALQWPPTKAARGAMSRVRGFDVEGYRDYRGREVVGAWLWDERLQAGIIVEQDVVEAYKTLATVDLVNQAAWGVPLLCALSIAFASSVRHWYRKGKSPTRVGNYRILEKIGEGGLGIVYRGEHLLLGRPSAVKLLKQASMNQHTIGRFEREVRLAARLVHPNAVSIYDYGISKSGSLYYAMEYIHGVNLAEFVAYARPIPLDRCVNILIQVCGAIREAHLEHLVHRDIKPQNIMVCYRGGVADVVKVLDYGLVKSILGSGDGNLTDTRVVMGTPKFMAPERLETPWIADPRVDIYSIGVVAYFSMLGHTPLAELGYAGMQTLMASDTSPYRQHAAEPAFQRLLQLIAQCVASTPTLRPSSIHDVLDRLKSIQEFYPWDSLAANQWWAEHEDALIHFGEKTRGVTPQVKP